MSHARSRRSISRRHVAIAAVLCAAIAPWPGRAAPPAPAPAPAPAAAASTPRAAEAAPLPPSDRARLDRAVIDHASGRLDAARAAFEALAARGVPAALFNLGVMHLDGQMPQPSVREAQRLLEQAARGGFVTAMVALGEGHENARFDGPRDLVLSHRWYEAAAVAGSPQAQLAAGTAYYLGRGAPRDYAQAARWFREAARSGDIGAMYLLASLYEAGDGVARDLRLARYWYALAAAGGDEAAPGKVREIDARLRREGGG
jgi:TPR repeat protein